jgi:hypothetical protein
MALLPWHIHLQTKSAHTGGIEGMSGYVWHFQWLGVTFSNSSGISSCLSFAIVDISSATQVMNLDCIFLLPQSFVSRYSSHVTGIYQSLFERLVNPTIKSHVDGDEEVFDIHYLPTVHFISPVVRLSTFKKKLSSSFKGDYDLMNISNIVHSIWLS